jgi:hypothetical protein
MKELEIAPRGAEYAERLTTKFLARLRRNQRKENYRKERKDQKLKRT